MVFFNKCFFNFWPFEGNRKAVRRAGPSSLCSVCQVPVHRSQSLWLYAERDPQCSGHGERSRHCGTLSPQVGVQLFTRRPLEGQQDGFNPDDVLTHLKKYPSALVRYLEHLVMDRNLQVSPMK